MDIQWANHRRELENQWANHRKELENQWTNHSRIEMCVLVHLFSAARIGQITPFLWVRNSFQFCPWV